MFPLLALAAHAEDLYVTSNERGAAILLDGVDTGATTPGTVRGVKPGRVDVTVVGPCSMGEALVDVLPSVTTRVSIVATEQLGTLSLVPSPVNAKIQLDGAPLPGSPGMPLAVSCGEHTLRAELDGYVPAVLTIDVGMGQDLTVPLTLQQRGIGTLELSVSPRSATIYLDGKPVGSDAVTLPSIYQGVHTIAAELDGYQSAKMQVAVEADSTAAYHFDLARVSQKRQTSTVTRLGGEPEAATSGKGAGSREVDDRALREAEAREAEEREAAEREAAEREAEREAARREEREAEAREAERREREAEEREAADRTAAARAEAEARREAEREAEAREAEEREAEREREAAARAAARRARAENASSTTRVEGERKPVGKTLAGIGLLAAGAGAGAYSGLAYKSAATAYDRYKDDLGEAGDDKQRQRLAADYYDDEVAPRQNLFYGTALGSALFLAGGVVVLVIDQPAPTFVPAPGGGMLLWRGRF